MPNYLDLAQCNHKGPYKREGAMEEEFMNRKDTGNTEKLKKREKMNSPLEPPEGTQAYQYFDFNPPRPTVDFWLSEL